MKALGLATLFYLLDLFAFSLVGWAAWPYIQAAIGGGPDLNYRSWIAIFLAATLAGKWLRFMFRGVVRDWF